MDSVSVVPAELSPAGHKDMTSPESKRAKGIRSPRQKKRPAAAADSLAMAHPGHYKDPGTENLSQLSDIVSREGLEPKSVQYRDNAPAINLSQQSQQSPGGTEDAPEQPELPSQPDIPLPAATASASLRLSCPLLASSVLKPSEHTSLHVSTSAVLSLATGSAPCVVQPGDCREIVTTVLPQV